MAKVEVRAVIAALPYKKTNGLVDENATVFCTNCGQHWEGIHRYFQYRALQETHSCWVRVHG